MADQLGGNMYLLRPQGYWDTPKDYVNMLDPSQYHSPQEEMMPLSGRPVASILPPGVWGATGTIIRRSDEQGSPIGHDPNAVPIRVNIDPDIPGEGFVVDLSQIKKAQMEQAAEHFGLDRSASLEDRRFRAANAFAMFRIQDRPDPMPNGNEGRQQPRHAPVNMPGLYVVPPSDAEGGQLPYPPQQHYQQPHQGLQLARPAQPIKQKPPQGPVMSQPPPVPGYNNGVTPVGQPAQFATQPQMTAQPQMQAQPQMTAQPQMQAQPQMTAQPQTILEQVPRINEQPDLFAQPPVDKSAEHIGTAPPVPATTQPLTGSLFSRTQQQPAAKAPETPASGVVGPPKVQVQIEIEGGPMSQVAWFHQVIKSGGSLVLAFDTRLEGYPSSFPQTTDNDVAVHVVGTDTIYVTKTTGIRFQIDQYDICVLLIKGEIPHGGQ